MPANDLMLHELLTDEEMGQLRDCVNFGHDLMEYEELWEKLYNHYLPDMPYGTAKARTGDPYDWIMDRVCEELDY